MDADEVVDLLPIHLRSRIAKPLLGHHARIKGEQRNYSFIPVLAWSTFFKIFSDDVRNLDTVVTTIESALRRYENVRPDEKAALIECFESIVAILRHENKQ